MNAPTPRGQFAHKLRPLDVTHFDAFQVTSCSITGNTIYKGRFDTLEEAVNASMVVHKSQGLVREMNELSGKVKLHFYQVTQRSQPDYRKGPDGTTQRFHKLNAKHLVTLELTDEITKGPTPLGGI